jgi:nucleotide-binding universal stress UspA family protein
MKILAALDGSDAAFNAMKSACRIASKTGSYVTAFYVNKGVEYSPEETGWTSIRERIARELETSGREVIHKAYKIGKNFDVPVEGVISDGIPASQIVAHVDAHGIIKLIAMGHSSKGRGAQEFVESTTKSVAARANVPVFVTSSEIDIRNILIAVGNSTTAGNVAAFGGQLAKSLGAELNVIAYVPDAEAMISEYKLIADVPNIERHIETSERDLREMLERTLAATNAVLDSVGVKASTVIKKGQADDLIAEARRYDLLVLGLRSNLSHARPSRIASKLLDSPSLSTVVVQ